MDPGRVVCSAGRPQDDPDLRVLNHECSQPVIVTCILPGDVTVGERQVAVSVQTPCVRIVVAFIFLAMVIQGAASE